MGLPEHVIDNIKIDPQYYSLYSLSNISRAKQDSVYLGEVLLVNEDLIWFSIHKYLGNPDNLLKNNCADKGDILQVGRLGFIKALNAFDVTRGVKFSSYAVTTIVREVRDFIRDKSGMIRPTRSASTLMSQIEGLYEEFGYFPSEKEIAEILGVSQEKVCKALMIGRFVKSLDEPIINDNTAMEQRTMVDLLEGDTDECAIVDEAYINSILDALRGHLDDKEVNILKHRIDGFNQTQAAKKEGVSQIKVNRVLKKITRIMYDKGMLDF